MVKTAFQEKPPAGVKLEVTALIDQKMWAALQKQGYTEKEMIEAIKKSITFRDTVSGGNLSKVPLFDIMGVDLLKYY